MRWVARVARLIPVDPDANLVGAMQASAAGLREGQVLLLFPEGERTIDGELKKFRKGAAILASHLTAPIVPVAISGAFPLWPRGLPMQWSRLLPWRVQPVTIRFGKPLQVEGTDYEAFTDRLRDSLQALQSSPPG
jgi:1-acyl-sn-glycerol-3-phosphate acyltransferase